MQYNLYLYLKSVNINAIILDSKKLLINPKKTLIKLCNLLNIPFYDTMLKWEREVVKKKMGFGLNTGMKMYIILRVSFHTRKD